MKEERSDGHDQNAKKHQPVLEQETEEPVSTSAGQGRLVARGVAGMLLLIA